MACAHSVVPLLQTSQMSGTANPGHGSVTGGGPASSQARQSNVPSGPHVQVLPHGPSGADAFAHPVPGMQAAPWTQPVGPLHVTVHWR
jgi:hypothetical protein